MRDGRGHRRLRLRGHRITATMLLVVAAALLAACGSSGSSSSASTSAPASTAAATPKPGTISLWLAGLFATATPGTPYRKWIDAQTARFVTAYPGSKVNVTLLPANNDQFSAKLQAAFSAHQVPDVMLIYSGGYTTPYIPSLLQLNSYVNQTPGMYSSISNWDLSCSNLDCQGGQGQIYGVPIDFGTYGLFYNKALLTKAGLSAPPTTFDQLLADCSTLKAHGILPIAYGDRDGYSTDNWVTYMYASYFAKGDVAKVNDGSLKYADPKLVDPLTLLVKLRSNGCVNQDASTRENASANDYFTSGKAAMVLMYPFVVSQFEQALKTNLGVAPIPVSGTGPLAGTAAGNSFHNFVIPKDAQNQALAFAYVKTATDATAGRQLVSILATPPANLAAQASITDPTVAFFAKLGQNPGIPLLDSVIPVNLALYYYKQLQAAFAGTTSPQQAMSNVDAQRAQLP
jgi:raffinose/stachyose/melibiose transport system substrate-binding protein